MSTAYNRRRGAKANAPRKVRVCLVFVEPPPSAKLCGAAVMPDRNGNDCGEHDDLRGLR